MDDNMTYRLSYGTVQSYVKRTGTGTVPIYLHHFGLPEYDRTRPVLSDSLRQQAQPIVDQLNRGEITEAEASKLLDQIHW